MTPLTAERFGDPTSEATRRASCGTRIGARLHAVLGERCCPSCAPCAGTTLAERRALLEALAYRRRSPRRTAA